MNQRPDDPYRSHEDGRHDDDSGDRPLVSHRGQILRGVAAATACAAALNVPWALLRGFIRPENVAEAVGSLLLSVNMLAGYAGGRACARAGLAHDDSRSQWTMAWTVSVLSLVIGIATQQLRWAIHPPRVEVVAAAVRHPSAAPATMFFVLFTATVLLVRFGFAMGTYAQAKREGRAVDEDEASAD